MELLEQTTQVERATVRAIAHDRARAIVFVVDFPGRDDRSRRMAQPVRKREWFGELRGASWADDKTGFLRIADEAHDDGLSVGVISEVAEETWPGHGRLMVEDWFAR